MVRLIIYWIWHQVRIYFKRNKSNLFDWYLVFRISSNFTTQILSSTDLRVDFMNQKVICHGNLTRMDQVNPSNQVSKSNLFSFIYRCYLPSEKIYEHSMNLISQRFTWLVYVLIHPIAYVFIVVIMNQFDRLAISNVKYIELLKQ